MADDAARTVTRLLRECREGDARALDRVMPIVYDQLRRLASRQMAGERAGHTLQPTALVHEVYARLFDAELPWQDRRHFFAVASRAMRRILVDHARGRASAKRGGGAERVTLADDLAAEERGFDLLDLDRALERLAEQDPRKAQAVELRYFAGLTYDEIAQTLDVSVATVHRELQFSRAWLRGRLESAAG